MAVLKTLMQQKYGVFSIADFGAAIDDSTDDIDAWEAAITAAHAVGGCVYHPGGVSCVSRMIKAPTDSIVSFVGAPGNSVIKAIGSTWADIPALIGGLATPADQPQPMLAIVSGVSGFGNRYGTVSHLRLDGNDVAGIGLHAFGVERTFESIDITDCVRCGLYVDGAQNCKFYNITSQRNGSGGTVPWPDANIVLDHGAANNNFYGVQASFTNPQVATEALWNVVICQSSETTLISGLAPFANTFVSPQFERSAGNSLGGVLQTSGEYNKIIGGLIAVTAEDTNVRRCVRVERATGTGTGGSTLPSTTLHVIGGATLVGQTTEIDEVTTPLSIVFSATTATGNAIVYDTVFVENAVTFLESDTVNIVHEGPVFGSFTNLRSSIAGTPGNAAAGGLIVSQILAIPAAPTGEPFGTSTYTRGQNYNSLNNLYNVNSGGVWRSTQLAPVSWAQPTYANPTLVNAASGPRQRITVTNADNFTVAPPTNAHAAMSLTIEIYNTSGGAMGTVTFDSGTGGYRTAGAFSSPATGRIRSITFAYDGAKWSEVCRTAADSI